MAGFADTFGAAANQRVSSFDNGGLKGGNTSVAGPAQPAVPKMQGGGVLGSLYNTIAQPIGNSVANVASDFSGLVGSAGTALSDVAQGKRGDNMVQSYLKSTPVGQAYSNAPQGKGLEMAAGNLGSDLLNVSSLVAGPEALAGKAGLGQLVKTGMKVGAAYGGLGGISNEMAQGGNAAQVGLAGAEGLGAGTLIGGVAAPVGAGVGKLAGKVAGKLSSKSGPIAAGDLAAQGSVATSPKAGFLKDFLNSKATQSDQNAYNADFAKNFAKNGATEAQNGINIGTVLASMKLHGIPATIINMVKYGNAGFAYNDFIHSIAAKGDSVRYSPSDMVDNAVKKAGAFSGTNKQALIDGLKSYLPNRFSAIYTPEEMLSAASKLYNIAVDQGKKSQAAVIDAIRKDLVSTAGEYGGLNEKIANTTLPTPDQLLKAGGNNLPGAKMTEHIMQVAGGNKTLADEIIANINQAKSIQELQALERQHIAANQIAADHAHQMGAQLPQAQAPSRGNYSTTGNGGISTAYELGMLARGNLGAFVPLGAKAGLGRAITKGIGKLGTADTFQVGPTVGPALPGVGDEFAAQAPAQQPPAEQPVVAPTTGPAVAPSAIASQAPQPEDILAQRQAAAPTQIGFEGNTPSTEIPVNSTTTQPSGPVPTDLRAARPGGTLNEPGGRPIDLRPTTEQMQPSRQVPVVSAPPAPSTTPTLEGLTSPGISTMDSARQTAQEIIATQGQRNLAGMQATQAAMDQSAAQEAAKPTFGSLARGVASDVAGRVPTLGGLTGRTAQTALPAGIAGLMGGAGAPAASGIGQFDTGQVDQLNTAETAAANPQPTLDANNIPGGTLADLQAEVQADPKNAAVYEAIYNDAQKEVAASAPPKLNSTQAKNLTNIQNATQTLSQYVTTLNSLNASTRGAGVGALSSLLGKVGLGGSNATSAAYLESKKPELAIQIAQAINNGTKPQSQQIKDIEAMLPSVNDPKALATQKIEQLAQSMQAYLSTAVNASVTNRSSGNTSNLLTQLTGGQ